MLKHDDKCSIPQGQILRSVSGGWALAFLEQYQQAQESLKGLVKSPMQVVRWWEGNMEQGLLKTNAGYDEDCSKYTTGYIVLDDSSNLTAAGLLLDFPSGFDTWSGAQRSQSGD